MLPPAEVHHARKRLFPTLIDPSRFNSQPIRTERVDGLLEFTLLGYEKLVQNVVTAGRRHEILRDDDRIGCKKKIFRLFMRRAGDAPHAGSGGSSYLIKG